MYSVQDKLKEKISSLSETLQSRYKMVLDIDDATLREFIGEEIGKIKTLEKLDKDHLKRLQKKGGIVGVDGSNNRAGGSHPHFVEAYQALAKSTIYKDDPLFLADIYSPLVEDKREASQLEDESEDKGEGEDKKNIKLATIEVEAAIEAVGKFKPYAILMDGGLIRYNIYANDRWEVLREMCESEGIILVGVIEDIKTSIIGDRLKLKFEGIDSSFYDRELLFGKLDYGEMIIINESVNKKGPEGYSSCFIRSSLTPTVIGMDILDSQKNSLEEMGRLILTLTPQNSRGIPLWLDIIDEEVKISDQLMKGLMERYMDRSLYERFFIAERDKRN
nr:DNA double-strand break repair nuclease NurA [Tissierella sp.]